MHNNRKDPDYREQERINRQIRKENLKIQKQLNSIHTLTAGDNQFQTESVKATQNCNYNKIFEYMNVKINNKDPSTKNVNG